MCRKVLFLLGELQRACIPCGVDSASKKQPPRLPFGRHEHDGSCDPKGPRLQMDSKWVSCLVPRTERSDGSLRQPSSCFLRIDAMFHPVTRRRRFASDRMAQCCVSPLHCCLDHPCSKPSSRLPKKGSILPSLIHQRESIDPRLTMVTSITYSWNRCTAQAKRSNEAPRSRNSCNRFAMSLPLPKGEEPFRLSKNPFELLKDRPIDCSNEGTNEIVERCTRYEARFRST